ncbi:hypothetical protein [Salinibacter altiplanensis]|uniref:hypothetical protein n=1 Tax=Salinibacter altiplanensis TaxID=1803181 RepID=UPI000C9EF2F4|nr:hypothetical protein [Salinibacter altiplanensis]
MGADATHRLWQYRSEKIITSAFASHLFRPVDQLAIQADLQRTGRRYRFYDENTFGRENMRSHTFTKPYFFANPRLGATPRFEQRADGTYNYDQTLIEPEQLVDVELGGTLERRRYRLSVNGFWMEFWDEIVQYVDNAGGTTASRREDGTVTEEEEDTFTVVPYALFGASLTYEPPQRLCLVASGYR